MTVLLHKRNSNTHTQRSEILQTQSRENTSQILHWQYVSNNIK